MAHSCFMQNCELDVQYVCKCLSSVAYYCEFHIEPHLKLPNRAHIFDSILIEPSHPTKHSILEFLSKEKAKKEKLKIIARNFFSQNSNNTENSCSNNLNSDLEEINSLVEMISQVSKKDKLNSLISQHDYDITETELSNDSEEYARVKLFCRLSQLRNKRLEILNKISNDPETEQDFRIACSLYENYASNSLISQTYQEYISDYQKIASTYLAEYNDIYIYNTETGKEELKTIEIPEVFKFYSVLTQIPNGELFFIGRNKSSRISCILDRDYRIRKLLLEAPWDSYGAIYFNRSIYCFGVYCYDSFTISRKFDLDKNRWSKFVRMVEDDIYSYCNSVLFNRNILISFQNCNIFLYSTDIDSFSMIPYSFKECKKILINGIERLYLIECKGWIYESEVENEYHWKQIGKSIIEIDPEQVCCSYNKGGIYISVLGYNSRNYFKFELNKKVLTEVAFYSENVELKRSGDELEAIDSYGKTIRLISNHAKTCIDKGYSLSYIGEKLNKIEDLNKKIMLYHEDLDAFNCACAWNDKGHVLCDTENYLEAIECYNEAIKIDPNNAGAYNYKGKALQELGRHLEAIECYNETIKLKPDAGYMYDKKRSIFFYLDAYINKGISLYELGKDLEAINCYNEAILLKSDYASGYFYKGIVLGKLARNFEAIECYNDTIKHNPFYADAYRNKGDILINLGMNIEAIECFNEAIKRKSDNAITYNSKGIALYNLERNIEAIDCYNDAIKLKIDEPQFYHNRANAFNKLGREIEAIHDFNKANDLMKNQQKRMKC